MAVNFGKYILLDKIATGGMAEIWLAKQVGVEGFEKLVVIKKILPHFTNDKEFVEMFLDEARIAAMLNHPNVVQIYDLGKEQNTYYIAMEFISGDDVKNILQTSIKQGHFLPIQLACNIISQAAEGLHYAHTLTDMYGTSLNIVHRDISPQNILVTFMGSVKIVDFGIAKAATQSQETRAGTLKGKFAYMSPEQALGKPLDGRSDVFALGIVLYEITLGKRLFRSDSELKTLKMITDEPVAPPVDVNPKYPPELSRIVMKSLEKDKNLRYKNARELHNDLEDFLKTYPKPSSQVDLSNWMKKTFEQKIKETKEKHEKLLREEPDEFVISNMLNETKQPNKSDSQVSNISNLSLMGSNPINFGGNNDNISNRSGLYYGGMTSVNTTGNSSSSVQTDDKNKFLLIGVVVLLFVIAAMLALFLLLKDNKSKCPTGYTGDNCTICATGFQDNDNDGACEKNCNLAKLACKDGEICSDQDGTAKCYSLSGKQKCPEGYKGNGCSICDTNYEMKEGKCVKKEESSSIADGTILEIPIKTEPSFADIVINNKLEKDKTNTILKFEVGKTYKLQIEKPGFIAIQKEFKFTSDITEFTFKLEPDTNIMGNSKMVIFKTPANAVVLFDGLEYKDTSEQMVINNLVQGQHELQVKADGYETFTKTITLSDKEPLQLTVSLQKSKDKYFDVSVISNPDGASVTLNNKYIGKTPIKSYSVKSQKAYVLKFSKAGYKTETITQNVGNITEPITVTLTQTSGNKTVDNTKDVNKENTKDNTKDTTKVEEVIVDSGTLTINTVPFTNVYVDGKMIGETPVMQHKLSVGKHSVKLVNESEMINSTISVLISKDTDLPQVVKFKKGILTVETSKAGAVIINGKTVRTGAMEKELYEGSYKVQIKDGNNSKTYDVTIKPGRTTTITF